MCNNKVIKYNTNGEISPYLGYSLLTSEFFNSLINSNKYNIYYRLIFLTQTLWTLNGLQGCKTKNINKDKAGVFVNWINNKIYPKLKLFVGILNNYERTNKTWEIHINELLRIIKDVKKFWNHMVMNKKQVINDNKIHYVNACSNNIKNDITLGEVQTKLNKFYLTSMNNYSNENQIYSGFTIIQWYTFLERNFDELCVECDKRQKYFNDGLKLRENINYIFSPKGFFDFFDRFSKGLASITKNCGKGFMEFIIGGFNLNSTKARYYGIDIKVKCIGSKQNVIVNRIDNIKEADKHLDSLVKIINLELAIVSQERNRIYTNQPSLNRIRNETNDNKREILRLLREFRENVGFIAGVNVLQNLQQQQQAIIN